MFKFIGRLWSIFKMQIKFGSELNNWFIGRFSHEEEYQIYLDYVKDKEGTIAKLKQQMQDDLDSGKYVPKEKEKIKEMPKDKNIIRDGFIAPIEAPDKSEERVLRSFFVTGPQHEKELMNNLKKIRKEAIEQFGDEPYDGLTNSELKADLALGGRVYQYTPLVSNIEFIDEKDNPYDKDALLVKAKGLKIGWILKKHQKEVREMIAKGYKFHGSIYGGKYKTMDFDDDSIKTENSELKLYVTENYKQDFL